MASVYSVRELARWLRSGNPISDFRYDQAKALVHHVNAGIEHKAAICGLRPRDFAATLVIICLSENGGFLIHIGDGGAVLRQGNKYCVASWPESGEYQNQTFFITDEESRRRMQFHLVKQHVDAFALFTDGIQQLALQFSTRTAHVPFFAPMFEHLSHEHFGRSKPLSIQLARFLSSKRVNSRTDDDKTLVLAMR